MLFIKFIIFSGIFTVCLCQRFLRRSCKNCGLRGINNLDVTKFSGNWFVYMQYENIFEKDIYCSKVQFTMIDSSTLDVVYRMKFKSKNQSEIIRGTLQAECFKIQSGLFYLSNEASETELTYRVIAIDYKSFAAVWACKNINIGSVQFLWILSRTRIMTENSISFIRRRLEENAIVPNQVTIIDNYPKECP